MSKTREPWADHPKPPPRFVEPPGDVDELLPPGATMEHPRPSPKLLDELPPCQPPKEEPAVDQLPPKDQQRNQQPTSGTPSLLEAIVAPKLSPEERRHREFAFYFRKIAGALMLLLAASWWSTAERMGNSFQPGTADFLIVLVPGGASIAAFVFGLALLLIPHWAALPDL